MGNRNKDIEKLFEQKNLLECKIKMIKQIIADLEKLKQDEFVYCFVDFNPYKDERLVESELGMIPGRMESRNLYRLAEEIQAKDREYQPRQGIGNFLPVQSLCLLCLEI